MPGSDPASGNPDASTSQPTYGSGVKYDSGAHDAVGDPTPPVDDGAKAAMSLKSRSDDDLGSLANTVYTAMLGNANFPTPAPLSPALLTLINTFTTDLQAQRATKAAALLATTEKDNARTALEAALNMRGSYVQMISNGNAAIIQSAAMPLKAPPTPVGVLDSPLNLRVDLNGTPGAMLVMWNVVYKARSYQVQWADATTPERLWSDSLNTTDRKLRMTDMEVGKTYAFRVRAIGGSDGQSLWSIEVTRMAA
jgi:hypothetical protein